MMVLKFWLYITTILSVQKYFFFFKLTGNTIINISIFKIINIIFL